jgi:hypothetical protein
VVGAPALLLAPPAPLLSVEADPSAQAAGNVMSTREPTSRR